MANWGEYFTVNNIVALILGIIGLVWLIHGIWRNSKINKINSWPKINARIIGAVAQLASDKNVLVDPKNIQIVDNSAKYIPNVTYEYQIGNMMYKSSSIVYDGEKSYSATDTKMIMDKLIVGSVIPIYYDPNNFSESYIYNNTHSYIGIIIGIILIVIAAYLGYRHNSNVKNVFNKKTKKKTMDQINPNVTDALQNRGKSRSGAK